MRWLRINSNGAQAALKPARVEAEEFFGALSSRCYEQLSERNVILDIIPRNLKVTQISGYRRVCLSALGCDRAMALTPVSSHANTLRFACDERFFLRSGKRVAKVCSHLPRYVMIHEGAHVVDNGSLSYDENSQIFDSFLERARTRRAWVTDYASTNFKEYFAESVAAFWDAPASLSETRCNRAWLRRNDPEMFALLGKIFPAATPLSRHK